MLLFVFVFFNNLKQIKIQSNTFGNIYIGNPKLNTKGIPTSVFVSFPSAIIHCHINHLSISEIRDQRPTDELQARIHCQL